MEKNIIQYTCKHCLKICRNLNSLRNHERLCKQNPDRDLTTYEKYGAIQGFNNKGRSAWNKGLTKESDERVCKQGGTFSNHFKEGLIQINNPMTSKEVRIKHKLKMKEVYANKPPRAHTRSKQGRYRGIWCDSSWELAWVIYALEHNIKFIRNTKGFKYVWEEEEHTYFPDFYLLNSNEYVEIKGYFSKRDRAKLDQFTQPIIVYTKNALSDILKYVIDKYGQDYYELYEK